MTKARRSKADLLGIPDDAETMSATTADVARALGITSRQVSALAESGLVVKTAPGKVDLLATIVALIAADKPAKSAHADRLKTAQADLAELKVRHAEGKLVRVDAVSANRRGRFSTSEPLRWRYPPA